MSDSKVLIDAGNLVRGGGLQVGVSFLTELAHALAEQDFGAKYPWAEQMQVMVSEELEAALDPGTKRVLQPRRGPRYGGLRRGRHLVAFTLFGPRYGRRPGRFHIMGFADGTSLFSYPQTQWHIRRIRAKVRAAMSKRSFLSADHIVVEAPFVAEALEREWGIHRAGISVVPNVVSRVFWESGGGAHARGERAAQWLVLYVGAAYPHKNHEFLPRVARALQERYGIDVRFQVTMTDLEWAKASRDLRECADNLGRVAVEDLPAAYQGADAAIFPSLIECSSVTPLEAMATGTPLLASDRHFVRDVARDAACYFDPMDPDVAAQAIAMFLSDRAAVATAVARGSAIASTWPTARDRMHSYAELIDSHVRRAGGEQ